MNRYYIKTHISPYVGGRLEDKVKELHCLFWDHKRKVHTFVRADVVKAYAKTYPDYTFGTPVVFECEEHEKEFLAYHPDAKCMRTYYQYGNFFVCHPHGINEDKLPFEWRKGRWCWKKTLTVA